MDRNQDVEHAEGRAFLDGLPTTLRGLFGGYKLRELLRVDLVIAILGGVGGYWTAKHNPTRLDDAAAFAGALTGAVVGAVIGGATIIGAFLSTPLLRKLRRIREDPAHHLTPFLFTGALGTVGATLCIVIIALSPDGESGFRTCLATATGFTVFYALGSLLPNLTNIVRFIRVLQDAAEIDDEAIGPLNSGR